MIWSVISATNNDQVLKSCLLSSPDINSATEVMLQRGYQNAAVAYNDAIDNAKTDILVFAHQDVYLPEGWVAAVDQALHLLSKQDPNWAVMGVFGMSPAGERAGEVYCGGAKRTLGTAFEGVKDVKSLDELLLIVRKSSGVRFDEKLGGFHMYGTDICLEAHRRGLKCYAISAFCVHNTNGYNMLPLDFWKSYLVMRRKWRRELPVTTPCTKITFWCWPMIKWNIRRPLEIMFKRHNPGKRLPDPAQFYREELAQSRPSAAPCAANH